MWPHIKPILLVIILATTMLISFKHGSVLENTTKCLKPFNLIHTTIPNYNWVTRILAHTLDFILSPAKNYIKSNSMFCCFSLYHMLQKKKSRSGAKSCAYRCIPSRAHPLCWMVQLFHCIIDKWVGLSYFVWHIQIKVNRNIMCTLYS